jgi:polyisoprenoid-binding protein YceI
MRWIPHAACRVAATGLLAGLLASIATMPAAAADTREYRLDPVHTRIAFLVDHAGFSRAIGTISGTEGRLFFGDDEDAPWAGASVEADIPVTALSLGDPDWDRATLARSLLDGEAHPRARFRSTSVEPLGPDRARIHGELTLRGATRAVVLDARLNGARRNPLTFRRTVGFSATTTLRRADFGITAWPNVIGAEVEVMIELEATAARRGERGEAEAGDAAPASTDTSAAPDAAPALAPDHEDRRP